jgi:hypothetical protein
MMIYLVKEKSSANCRVQGFRPQRRLYMKVSKIQTFRSKRSNPRIALANFRVPWSPPPPSTATAPQRGMFTAINLNACHLCLVICYPY